MQSAGTPEWSPAGDLAAVGALVCWSAYWVVAKRSHAASRQRSTRPARVRGSRWCRFRSACSPGTTCRCPRFGDWLPLAGLIVAGGVLGHAMMNWAIVRVPLWLGSTLTLLIPVISSLMAWLFLDEPLTVVQVLGMGVVIAALAAIVTSQRGASDQGL